MNRKLASSKPERRKISRRLEIKYDIDALIVLYRNKRGFRYEQGERELDKLLKKYGDELYDDLLKRLDNWDGFQQESLFWMLNYLGDDALVRKLYAYSADPTKNFKSRLIALSLLRDLGQDIQSEVAALHTSFDLDDLQSLMSESIHYMLDRLQEAKGSDEIQNILFQLEELKDSSIGGEDFLHFIIEATFARNDPAAADFLRAMSIILPTKTTREKARVCFQKLRLKGIQPRSEYLDSLSENRLYKAFLARIAGDPIAQLTLGWERENDLVQAYVFLIEDQQFTDFFVTQNMSKTRFDKEFHKEVTKVGAEIIDLTPEDSNSELNDILLPLIEKKSEAPQLYYRFQHMLEPFLSECRSAANA